MWAPDGPTNTITKGYTVLINLLVQLLQSLGQALGGLL